MLRLQLVKVFLLVVLLVARTESKPAKGRKSAFGLGLLGGALAGAAVGHAVVKSSQGRTNSPAPAAVAPTRVVETGSLDARGCYKQ
ncbi:CG31496, partial [Drosophila busckii]